MHAPGSQVFSDRNNLKFKTKPSWFSETQKVIQTMKTFHYGQDTLTASIALGLARKEIKGLFSKETVQKIQNSAKAVEKIAQGEAIVYGINTGFGPLCTTKISASDTKTLQENLLKSHAVGGGQTC